MSQARRAIVSRWMKQRFGTNNFEKLGIPGWEIVDLGLRDLADGNHSSVAALAVAEVRPRLRFLGVPVPDVLIQNTNIRMRLYRTMEEQHQDMAHARFCALLERVDSFCDTLAVQIRIPKHSTHRHRRWCS